MTKYEDSFILKDKVTETLNKINGGLDKFNDKIKGVQAQLEHFSEKGAAIKKLGKSFQDVGNKMTVGVTLPAVAMGGAMVKAAADMEAMQQQLSTMLGSEEQGAKMFDDIKQMAAKTPFGTKDLMSATNTMLGFGIAQEKVLPLMRQLGDISGGNVDRFRSLSLAFSQVSAAGKLSGQDLLQMINAGFNPLETIANKTGKSVGYWKEQMSKGKVTVQMVEQAMKDATSEGGRFFNMMEKQSKTALGQWSTLQDNLNQTLAEFGKIILPYAIKALQKLSALMEKFNSLSPGAKKTILVIGGILAILGPMISLIGTLITVIGSLNVAFAFLAANPVVLAIAAIVLAIAGLITIIVLLVKNWDKVKAAAVSVCQAIAKWWGGLVEKFKGWIGKLVGWLDALIEKLGFLAYFIPGLNAIKLTKDITNAVGNKGNTNNNQTYNNQKTFNTTNNTYNNYNSLFPTQSALYT